MSVQSRNIREPENIGAVIVVVHPDGNKILLGIRKNCYKAGWWGMPGGRSDTPWAKAHGFFSYTSSA